MSPEGFNHYAGGDTPTNPRHVRPTKDHGGCRRCGAFHLGPEGDVWRLDPSKQTTRPKKEDMK